MEIQHNHCFHETAGQHMMPHHKDVICCVCGKTACLNLKPVYNIGHGKFAANMPIVEIQEPDLAWPHGRGNIE